MIEKGKSCLFLRIPDYYEHNAIEEHIKTINEKGYTWLLKLGNYPNHNFLKRFMNDGGLLLLKTTPRNGNKFYIFKVTSISYDGDNTFPSYYDDLLEKEGYTITELKSNFLWLKLESYKKVSIDFVNNFETISNNKPMINSIMKSRAPQVYGQAIKDIEI